MMKFIFLFYGFFLLTYNSFAQANKYTPRIEYCSCRFRIDSNFVKSVPSPKIRSYFSQPLDKIDSSFKTHCGYLIVPENRKKLRSNMVKLPFIIIESKNPHKKADPVLFAAGGPGGSILSWTSFMTNSPMIHDRDLIFFEQRGTRYAIPRLMSFELDSAIRESYLKNLNKDSMVVESLKRYKKTLEKRGIDLSGYNTDETVSDIHDLLSTLKINSVNLYGVSYSGGLMMEVLRRDPTRIRSLVLDSPLPTFIPIDEDEPANFNEALDILFRHVEKDSSDQRRYGNLRQRFRQYFTAITGKVFYIPYAGHSVQYTKNELLDVINDNLSDDESRKNVAFIITEMISGRHFKYVKERLDELFGGNAPDAMRISVYCADQAAYHSEAVLHELSGPYPYMAGYHINDVYKKMCDCWNVPPVKPLTKQPFYSTKPALLADGEMDPACRPLYIDRIHHYLPNSQRFLFLNRGHGVGGKDMDRLFTEFLDNPYRKIESPNATIVAY